MSDKKDVAKGATQKKAVELKKQAHVLLSDYKVGEKSYKKGDKIMLTPEGRAYLKSIHKI
jgi:hypothetical protein